MTSQDAPAWLAERPEIETIFACICDLNGVMRGKRVPIEQLDKITSGALRMPLSLLSMDIWGEDIEGNDLVFDTGDADGLCDFTGRPISPVDWTSRPAAFAQLWMRQEDGRPFMGWPETPPPSG